MWPSRPGELFKSATSLLRKRFLSFSVNGKRQTNSPVSLEASKNSSKNASSFVSAPVLSIPRATITPPVKVATSMMRVAPICLAYVTESASTSLPSASVLRISIVLPLNEVMTSSGLNALPDTILSVDAMTAITFLSGFSSPMIFIAPRTAAAPPISPFMPTMPSFGFNE